jgi:hypothetical protein
VGFSSAAAGRVLSGHAKPVDSSAREAGAFSTLYSVSCPSALDCWAVGSYSPAGSGLLTEALHWDGHRWTRVSTPNPAGTSANDDNGLVALACVSASDCWAVGVAIGYSERPFTGAQNLLLHWDGSTWSLQTPPQPQGGLSGIACPSASDCWVFGRLNHQALHWDGSKWSLVTVPREADTVSCLSASSCWAVGSDHRESGSPRDVILRWDGHSWAHLRSPSPTGGGEVPQAGLSAVACGSKTNCWAVGDYSPPSALHLDQAVHWGGSRWSGGSGSLPGNRRYHPNWLDGVTCLSPSDCWAVGAFGKGEGHLNQIQHWTGHNWSLISVPQPAGRTRADANVLDGAFCVSHADCWAVGWSQIPGKPNINEILHWNGRRWSDR